MRKTVLILGMILALTLTGGFTQAQDDNTTKWTVTHFCVHDSQDESLMENDSLSTYVMTIVHKAETGDYGSVTIGDVDQKSNAPLLESDGQGYVFYLQEQGTTGQGTFCFNTIDQDGAECYLCAKMVPTQTGEYILYLGVKYGNKILYWTAKYIKEEPKREA
jgi:hypothetical protein